MPTSRTTVRQQLVAALAQWFLTGERAINAATLDDLLREPDAAPLAARLGYDADMTLLQRDRLEMDVRHAVRRARTAEALRLGQDPGVPARTDRAFSLALVDVVAATREAARRIASAEQDAHNVGDAPAEFELERLRATARALAGECALLYESRALRSAVRALVEGDTD